MCLCGHQDDRVRWETKKFLPIQGCEVTHPSQQNVPSQVPVMAPVPGTVGLGAVITTGPWQAPVPLLYPLFSHLCQVGSSV